MSPFERRRARGYAAALSVCETTRSLARSHVIQSAIPGSAAKRMAAKASAERRRIFIRFCRKPGAAPIWRTFAVCLVSALDACERTRQSLMLVCSLHRGNVMRKKGSFTWAPRHVARHSFHPPAMKLLHNFLRCIAFTAFSTAAIAGLEAVAVREPSLPLEFSTPTDLKGAPEKQHTSALSKTSYV